ncbi:MAG TPA: hypothetical protein VIM60_03505 [Edaphobacter sp.]
MRNQMKVLFSISTMLLLFGARSYGQAAPSATLQQTPAAAGAVPKVSWSDGTLHYALSAAELVQIGYYGSGNVTSTTALTGNVGYVTLSETAPFTLLYAGGVLVGQGGQGSRTYHNVAVSQDLIKGRWVMGISDAFSFLPQSPTVGISGISGVDPIGTIPGEGVADGPTGGVLTYSNNRIGNTVTGNIERLLTGKTSISGVGSYRLLHFLDDNAGLDTRSITGQVAINHRMNVRNSLSLSAVYSTYETRNILNNLTGYPYNNITYQTKGLNVTYMRQWTRSLASDISVGPQWVQSSAAQLVPSRVNTYANAGLTYTRQIGNFGLRYTRGVNNGSGAFAGAIGDSISGTFTRSLSRDWAVSSWVSYAHTTGLLYTTSQTTVGNDGAINTVYGTMQLRRRFTRTISGYASYSAQNQDVNSRLAAQNVFTGLSHTIGFGVSWAPKSTRLGDF